MSESDQGQSPRALYLRLLSYVLPYWRGFAIALVAMVVLAGTEPALPALLEQVVGGFENNDVSGIPLMAIAVVVLFMIRGLAAYSSAVALASVASKLVRDLRAAMFDKLLAMPIAAYEFNHNSPLKGMFRSCATDNIPRSTLAPFTTP